MSGRIVMTHPTSLGRPGGGTVGFLQIVRHLRAAGVDVTVVSVDRGPWSAPSDGSHAISLRPVPGHRYLDAPRVANTVRSLVSEQRVDAVIGWGSEAAFFPDVLRGSGVKLGMVAAKPSYEAWWDRRVALRPVKRLTDRLFYVRTFERADVVFALSSHTRNELMSLFGLSPRTVVINHWGVDEVFAAVPPRRRDEPLGRLLFMGSLDPEKGVFDAIRALGVLRERPWELRVAGWGNEAAVRSAADAAGIGNRVTMLGTLNRSGVLDEIARAQLAVLPSHVESFGLAIAEAQASGLPVVSYRTGSIPEVVEDGVTGSLVPCGHIDRLMRAIADLMDHPSRAAAMGEAGRARIAREFRWERTAGGIMGALLNREAVSR